VISIIRANKIPLNFFLINNLILLIILTISSYVLKSLSVFCFGIVTQILVNSLVIGSNYEKMKYIYLSYIYGIIFTNTMYFALIANHGVPYINARGSDDLWFEKQAFLVANQNISSIDFFKMVMPGIQPQYKLYIWILSKLVDFGSIFDGYHLFMSRQLNIILIVLICNMLYFIVKKEYYRQISSSEQKRFFIALAIFPNFYNIASYTFRDILSLFLVITLVWALTHIKYDKFAMKYVYIIIAIFAIILQFYVRKFLMYAMIVIVLLYLIDLIPSKYRIICDICVVMVVISFVLFFRLVIYSIFEDGMDLIRFYSEYRINESHSELVSIFMETPILPFGIFLRFIFGFIQPNPSLSYLFEEYAFLYSVILTFIGIGTLYLLSQMPYAIKGFLKPFDKLSMTFLLLYTLFLSSLTFRHLVLIYPFLFLLIARGRENKINKYKGLYQLYLTILIGIYVAYSIIRIY